mmetsp:Transcript_79685/g.228700  ORF Transcript_79685/g.228700 Transcript_79685/m.228700 type:complete len:220 (+) Transcript_79685:408-1067(+)
MLQGQSGTLWDGRGRAAAVHNTCNLPSKLDHTSRGPNQPNKIVSRQTWEKAPQRSVKHAPRLASSSAKLPERSVKVFNICRNIGQQPQSQQSKCEQSLRKALWNIRPLEAMSQQRRCDVDDNSTIQCGLASAYASWLVLLPLHTSALGLFICRRRLLGHSEYVANLDEQVGPCSCSVKVTRQVAVPSLEGFSCSTASTMEAHQSVPRALQELGHGSLRI